MADGVETGVVSPTQRLPRPVLRVVLKIIQRIPRYYLLGAVKSLRACSKPSCGKVPCCGRVPRWMLLSITAVCCTALPAARMLTYTIESTQ